MLSKLHLHLPSFSKRLTLPVAPVCEIVFPTESLLHSKSHQQLFSGWLHENRVCVKRVPLPESDLAWNEAFMLSLLTSNHLPRNFGIGVKKDDLWVITELLYPMVPRNYVPNIQHLIHIAQALFEMHEKHVIHRDVKLANVLFTTEDQQQHSVAKLIDLDRAILAPNNTHEEMVGTVTHMAPELLAGKEYSNKVDVYAFGITMFEMLHPLQRPFPELSSPGLPDSLTPKEFAAKVVSEGLRPKNWTFPNPRLRKLAEQCWLDDANARPSFKEILVELEKEEPSLVLREGGMMNTSCDVDDKSSPWGSCSHIGRLRTGMEDASFVFQPPTKKMVLLGVFDGLKGARSAEIAAKLFPLLWDNTVEGLSLAFSKTDDLLKEMKVECGCTGTVALVTESALHIGWVGDSSAYLFPMDNSPQEMTVKHSPDRLDERARIEAEQGVVFREKRWLDNGEEMFVGPWRAGREEEKSGVAISRALGVFSLRPIVSAQPEFKTFSRKGCVGGYLVLASDGLWDVVGVDQIHQVLITSSSPDAAAEALVNLALDRGGHDNISVLVIRL